MSSSRGNADGDTLDNLSEYIAGTDPTVGYAASERPSQEPNPVGIIFCWNAVEDRVYEVSWTDRLTNAFLVLKEDILFPQNSYTDTIHAVEDGGFYRVSVKLQD